MKPTHDLPLMQRQHGVPDAARGLPHHAGRRLRGRGPRAGRRDPPPADRAARRSRASPCPACPQARPACSARRPSPSRSTRSATGRPRSTRSSERAGRSRPLPKIKGHRHEDAEDSPHRSRSGRRFRAPPWRSSTSTTKGRRRTCRRSCTTWRWSGRRRRSIPAPSAPTSTMPRACSGTTKGRSRCRRTTWTTRAARTRFCARWRAGSSPTSASRSPCWTSSCVMRQPSRRPSSTSASHGSCAGRRASTGSSTSGSSSSGNRPDFWTWRWRPGSSRPSAT